MSPVIRVLVADDQRVVREGLGTLLGLIDGIEVVGTAADGDEAVALAVLTRPDVATSPKTSAPMASVMRSNASPAGRPSSTRPSSSTSWTPSRPARRARTAPPRRGSPAG